MNNNDYRDYLNVLRTREARPPFEQMVQLVAAAPARSTGAIPLYTAFVGALFFGGIIVAGAWVLSAKYNTSAMPRASNPVITGSSFLSLKPHLAYAPHGSLSQKFDHTKNKKLSITSSTEKEGSVLYESKLNPALITLNDDNSIPSIQPCAVHQQTNSIIPSKVARPANLLIGVPRSDKENSERFFVTVGGGIAEQFSSDASFRQFSFSDAFIGVGSSLSENTSIRILGGEEVFSAPSSTTSNSVVFHDTTLSSYKNVLGEIQSVNIPTITRIYWLGASYRYSLGNDGIRPFAEVMAGGSTDGFLTHQSLGAEFTATNNIDLDLQFQASEMRPSNSSWLTKGGLSASMEYRW
jgi:hypothetical protein